MNTAAAQSRVYHDAAKTFGPDEQQARINYARMLSLGIADAMATHQAAANGPDKVRQDAQTAVVAARQLEYVMTQLYEEPRPDLKMANGDIIDINREVPAGAKTFIYYLFTGGAMARFMGSWSSPNAMNGWLQMAEKSGRTQGIESGYRYSMLDLIQAGYANLPLESMFAKNDQWAHQRLKNDVGLWGKSELGLVGLVKHPNITAVRAALNAGATSRTWAAKTAAEIMVDIGVLVNTASQATEGRRRATHVWLPRVQYDLIGSMLLTSTIAKTVLAWAKETYPGVTFDVLDNLAASKSTDQWGTTHLSSDAALSLVKDPDVVQLVDPMAYTQYPVQYDKLNLVVPTMSITGGVMAKEPFTIVRLDGI